MYSLIYQPHKGWYSFIIKCGTFSVSVGLQFCLSIILFLSTLRTLTSFVYTFGFVSIFRRCPHVWHIDAAFHEKAQLIPQLIINYKLKVCTLLCFVQNIHPQHDVQSVAHLPMKAFVYKFLGTIVDDFFAYVTLYLWSLSNNGAE